MRVGVQTLYVLFSTRETMENMSLLIQGSDWPHSNVVLVKNCKC